jgi:hypothetical protein
MNGTPAIPRANSAVLHDGAPGARWTAAVRSSSVVVSTSAIRGG